jgi:hypothetical protein
VISAAGLMLVITAVGFRFFILHGKGLGGGEITKQIVPLIVAHGFAMFGWVVLFFVQSVFILVGNRRLHMVIGPAGAVLAAAIVILGSTVASLSVHFNPSLYQPFGGARFFLALMFGEMLTFGGLVATGMLYRRRAEIHRPMMLLATALITGAALGRVPYMADLLGTVAPLYQHNLTLSLGALLFLLHWAMTGRADRWFAASYAGLGLACLATVAVGNTAQWNQIAGLMVP